MSVVLSRPYEFVPPHRGNFWPSLIQRFRLVDRYLAKKEGVVDYEVRGIDHLRQSLRRGDGILLAPNHCRYADPLVIGWPARELGTQLFAMASWHLFNTGWFDKFAIRKMGGFSIHREGPDRKSLDTAIGVLAEAQRPLILFPEGTTNRTNDVLKPLLDGIVFIARSAARRRAKSGGGEVVMHPVALKYLCVGDAKPWAMQQLDDLERYLGWEPKRHLDVLARTICLAEAMLALKEIEHLGKSISGPLPQRRDSLMEHLLATAENELSIEGVGDVRDRVRQIRSEVVTRHFQQSSQTPQSRLDANHQRLAQHAHNADLAQELSSYPDCYLHGDQVTDTRIVETIQRIQEMFFGAANVDIRLKVVIQFDEPIKVPAAKPKRGQPDPLMQQLDIRLKSMLEALSSEAVSVFDAGMASETTPF